LELVPFPPGTPEWPFRHAHAQVLWSQDHNIPTPKCPGQLDLLATAGSRPRLPDTAGFLTKCSRLAMVIMVLTPRTFYIFLFYGCVVGTAQQFNIVKTEIIPRKLSVCPSPGNNLNIRL